MDRREAITKANRILAGTIIGTNMFLETGCKTASKHNSTIVHTETDDGVIYRPPINFKEMASLAAHHYSHMLDDSYHSLPYFFAKLNQEESYAWHTDWDFGDSTGRYLDSLILCERIIGKKIGLEAGNKLKEALRWMRSNEDGLFYRKTNEWVVESGAGMFDQSRAFLGLLSWYFENKEEEPKRFIDQLIQSLKRIGVEKDDYICFPFETYVPGMAIPEIIFTDHGFLVDPCIYGGGVLILPLVLYYEETGDNEALYLLEKLTRFITKYSRTYEEDGSFWSRARYEGDGHFHAHMSTVVGILRFATIKSNSELVNWCYKVYKWACSMGSSYGWFPEGTGLNGKEPVDERYRWLPGIIQHSETCATTDMIHTAIYLAKNGMDQHWDDAERYMNVLSASQMENVSWAKTVTDKAETPSRSYKDIPYRYMGGFTGRMNPNDFTNNGLVDTMACCCGAGGKGLYLLWNYAVENKNEGVFVNLWFNKENDFIKVESAVPQKGSMKVEVKNECSLHIRLPAWLDTKSIKISDGRKELLYTIKGNYMRFHHVPRGTTVHIDFPLETRVVAEIVAGKEYKVTWRGNYLIAIDPKGKYMSLESML